MRNPVHVPWNRSMPHGLLAALLAIGLSGCPSSSDAPSGDSASAATGETPTEGSGAEEAAAEEAAAEPEARALPLPEDPAMEERASVLLEARERDAFPRELRERDNGPVFLYIAARHAEEDVGLRALTEADFLYTGRESQVESKVLVDDDYVAVVLYYITHEDPARQVAGLRAARTALQAETPAEALTSRLVEMATSHPEPAGRWEALNTLGRSSNARDSADQRNAFIQALEAEQPYLVSEALWRLDSLHRGMSEEEQVPLRARAIELTSHADPGVRGRAADLVASMASGFRVADEIKAQSAAALMPLLQDPNPFVKSSACSALAGMDHREAIHTIITMVDDLERNTYDIDGWTRIDGSRGRIHHDGSAWSRTGDAALSALRRFGMRVGERFEYNVNHEDVEGSLTASAAQAREWYASVQAQLPAAP